MEKGIFVLGELNVDLIFSADEIEIEWNREKLVDRFELVLGSSSAITACALAGLGEKVYFVSVVGDDEFGHFCIERLQEKGVDTQFIKVVPTLKTGVTLSLSTLKDRALLTYMGAISELTENDLPDQLYTLAKHIHFGSFYLQKKMRHSWKGIFQKAKQAGMTTSFDTGWAPDDYWYPSVITELMEYTDLFIPSKDELKMIYPMGSDEITEVIPHLPDKRGIVAVKQGSKGATLITNADQLIHEKAFDVVPIDTTGAGDSFNAGLITGYLYGYENEVLLEFASACGALATQRIGGASEVPTVAKVMTFIESHKSSQQNSGGGKSTSWFL